MEQATQRFILTNYAADQTISPVDRETLIQQVEALTADQQLRLAPEPSILVKGLEFVAMNCVRREDGQLFLLALLRAPGQEALIGHMRSDISRDTALEELLHLLESGQAPDLQKNGWRPVQMQPMAHEEAVRHKARILSKEAQEEKLGSNKGNKK